MALDLLNNDYSSQLRQPRPGGVEWLAAVISDWSLVTEHRPKLTLYRPPLLISVLIITLTSAQLATWRLICCHPLFTDEHDVGETIIAHRICYLLCHSSLWRWRMLLAQRTWPRRQEVYGINRCAASCHQSSQQCRSLSSQTCSVCDALILGGSKRIFLSWRARFLYQMYFRARQNLLLPWRCVKSSL